MVGGGRLFHCSSTSVATIFRFALLRIFSPDVSRLFELHTKWGRVKNKSAFFFRCCWCYRCYVCVCVWYVPLLHFWFIAILEITVAGENPEGKKSMGPCLPSNENGKFAVQFPSIRLLRYLSTLHINRISIAMVCDAMLKEQQLDDDAKKKTQNQKERWISWLTWLLGPLYRIRLSVQILRRHSQLT